MLKNSTLSLWPCVSGQTETRSNRFWSFYSSFLIHMAKKLVFLHGSFVLSLYPLQNLYLNTKTSEDMDIWLTLIFTKSETTWDIITKISAFLQLMKKWILSKFGGCSSKIELATPIWCFRRFWQEIQILCTKNLHIWYKVGSQWF